MSTMTTLLRRELWENRAITIAPAIFGGLFVLVTLLAAAGAVHVQVGHQEVDVADLVQSIDQTRASALLQLGLASLAVTFNMVMIFVTAFYLLDALYADRKDRSILFWKSLPVSDTTIVGSKLVTAALVIPLVTLAIFLATEIGVYLISGTVVTFSGSNSLLLAGPGAIFETTLTVLYALLVQSLWYMPLFGWLLLVSAWARKATLLWAVLPPFGVIAMEELLFGTERFAQLLGHRLIGVIPLAFRDSPDDLVWKYEGQHGSIDIETSEGLAQLIDPGTVLSSPGLWGGLVVGAVFFAGAVWLRRFRDES